MGILEGLALFAGAVYLLQTLVLLMAWNKKIAFPASSEIGLSYSIVIAFRNEARALPALCADLNALDYPRNQFEVILVNDHSDDEGESQIRQTLHPDISLTILSLNDGQGKKQAMLRGIQSARYDWIVCTDADCRVPASWLRLFSDACQSSEKVMWCGRVYFSEKSWWDRLLSHEFSSVMGMGGATLQMNRPTMCNGANLAFSKVAFYEVGGYSGNEQVASGDDEFLMHKLHQRFPGGVGFLNHPQHTVYTTPPQSLRELLQQRVRWASKWQHYQHPFSRNLAVFTLLLQSGMLLFPFLALGGLIRWEVIGLVWGLKLLLDSVFIHTIRKDFERSVNLFILLCLEVVYPGYVLYVGVISRFSAYQWKGRRIK